MKSLREIILITLLSATALLPSCKTEEPYIDPFMPVPVGAYITEDGVQTEIGERQAELEEIIQEYNVKHVVDIIYYDELNLERYHRVMHATYGVSRKSANIPWDEVCEKKDEYNAVTIITESRVGIGKPSVIIVPSTVFEKHENKQDLVSFIVDHEGMHARDNATGLTLNGEKVTLDQVGRELYEDIMELRAYNNQLVQIEKGRAVSEECRELVISAYCAYHQILLVKAINGNKYAQAGIAFGSYTPVIDLDKRKKVLIRREEFFKGSEFEEYKECPENPK